MNSKVLIIENQYYDSLFLMGINKRLSDEPGITQSAVLMGTENNKKLLAEIGLLREEAKATGPNDLIIGVFSESEKMADEALSKVEGWLDKGFSTGSSEKNRTFESGLLKQPSSNLAVITVPGEFAAREANKALNAGLNVFIFSSNVDVEEELELKTLAREKGLLVMGPDCGTSIINGVGIGFANRVRKGAIGVIGASGTGLQEFTSQVHNAGFGISHAIGTGSRDLSNAIGGLTTIYALHLLQEDDETKVIVIVSKLPEKATLAKLVEEFKKISKPVVACFLGFKPSIDGEGTLFKKVDLIDDAVALSISCLPEQKPLESEGVIKTITPTVVRLDKHSQRKFIRGLFAGGTFCYQTQQIFTQEGIPFYSSYPLEKKWLLKNPEQSQENSLIDMGDEYFTLGKPHPMMDGTMRAKRIRQEGADPEVAILLLDFILGFNASNDPVGGALDAIKYARGHALSAREEIVIVASVTGTKEDSQDADLQIKLLEEAGVIVFRSNAQAAQFCAKLLKGE